MSAEKRKRSVNFSVEEKLRFLRILQKKGNVIISKVNAHDLVTNRLKEDAWLEITNDLNASGILMRTTDNLKKLWQKMKSDAKNFKSPPSNQICRTYGEPSKQMHDPVLELVLKLTDQGRSGKEFVNVCDSEILNTDYSLPIETSIIVEHVSTPDEVVTLSEVCKENDKTSNVTPKTHLKRSWPVGNEGRRKLTKVSLYNNFARERVKCEKDKRAFIALQKQYMAAEHILKIKHAELKTKILEIVLNKIQDEKPVDSELLKIMSNV